MFHAFPVVFPITSAPFPPIRAVGSSAHSEGETAEVVMPDEITEPRFLQDWKQEILEVAEARWKHRWWGLRWG